VLDGDFTWTECGTIFLVLSSTANGSEIFVQQATLMSKYKPIILLQTEEIEISPKLLEICSKKRIVKWLNKNSDITALVTTIRRVLRSGTFKN
jgi:hypothetical protein